MANAMVFLSPSPTLIDFDTAIDLSYRYLEEADLAEARGDTVAEEQWSTWAEQLQLWAARRVGAPGRAWAGIDRASGADRTVTMHIRRAVHACDQLPPFSEMTRR